MESSEEFELGLLRSRLARQRAILVIVALAAAGALAWNVMQGHAAALRNARLRHMTAVVDSLRRTSLAQRSRFDPLEQRVNSLGTVGQEIQAQLRDKADRRSVLGLDSRLDRLVAAEERQDSALARLEGNLAAWTRQAASARDDSLGAMRRMIDARFAATTDSLRQHDGQLLGISRQVAEIERSRASQRKWTAVRDVATLTGLAMITAHIAGSE